MSESTEPKPMPDMLSPEERVARTIRVDQAGEYGAVRIYQGQRAVLGKAGASAKALAEMEAAERQHLATFNALMVERRVRPTALSPLWHIAGFALGAGTALLGEKAAMACTVAVEDVIEEHYARQAEALKASGETKLVGEIERARAGELEHRDTALAAGAKDAPGYEALTAVVKAGSKLAIWLSERI
ncbi:MAG TPA: demethoxyubiquinone hydroxylase family protein [Magnetospirillaceae bacterium]